MLKLKHLLLLALFAPLAAHSVGFPNVGDARANATIQPNPVPFSNAGMIQNVQSYSSNPFHNPDSVYNQRMPTPIYAQGTELNAGDCQRITAALMAAECGRRGGCATAQISDIRPAIMQQLSVMPGHNYVSSCGGFIDSAFVEQKNYAQTMSPGGFPATFPMTGTGAIGISGGALSASGGRELAAINTLEERHPQWREGLYDRLGEMRGLQAQNAQDTRLVATTMPGTFDELSFTERMDILKQGYEPWRAVYKDGKCIENCAYRTNFDIETNEQRRDREKAELAHMKEMNYCKWCKEFREDCKIERRKLADEETRKSEAEKCKPGAPTGTQYDVYDIIRNDIPTGNPAPDEFRSEDDDEAADRCYIPVEVRKANCPPPPPPPVIPPPPPNGGVERRCWCGSIGRHVDSADANDNTCTVVRPDTTLCSGAVRACNVSAGIVASFPKYICQQSSPLVNAQLVFDCCL